MRGEGLGKMDVPEGGMDMGSEDVGPVRPLQEGGQ